MKYRSAVLSSRTPWLLPHIVALLLVLLWSPLSSAKALRYEVTGIKGALKENVEIHLAALPSIQAGRIDYRRQSIQQAVTQGLQAQGYYQSTIELVVDEQDESLLHVRIKRGKPVRIRSLVVRLLGDALNDDSFERLMQKLPLKQGDVLHHGKYE